MSNKPINFTKATIEQLPLPPTKKRSHYRDKQVKGLTLIVTASGNMSFYVIKKINYKAERIFLGTFPDLTIEKARSKAKVVIGKIATGINPQDETRTIKAEMTLGQLFEQYMNRYSKVHKKTWWHDEKDIPRFLSQWFKRRLSSIKRAEVQLLHEQIFAENGLYQANKILTRLRAMYNKAISWDWQGTNPTLGIKKYKETSRDRFIQPAEMPCVIHALNEETNQTAKDFLWMLFLTGARKTNMRMMRWEQINWQREEWRIPNTKNGEPVIVPLTPRAIDILAERQKNSESEWVFPKVTNFTKHIGSPNYIWKNILRRASINLWKQDKMVSAWVISKERKAKLNVQHGSLFTKMVKQAKLEKVNLPPDLLDIRLHDIRRTFGSYQAITGASLQTIGKSLGHKSVQATQIYSRLNLDPVRSAVEKATEAMFNFCVTKSRIR